MAKASKKQSSSPAKLYVLIDESADVLKFAGPKEIDADKLGEQLQKFNDAVSRALEKCKSIAGQYELQEISLEAKLTAEFGFVLVSKAGVEGSISLKFAKK